MSEKSESIKYLQKGKSIEINDLLLSTFENMYRYEEESLARGGLKDLSITEIHTINNISQYDFRTMSRIAADLDITQSTLTVCVDKLVKKEYVERFRDDKDRRIVMVRLTKKGRLAFKMHERFHKLLAERMTKELSEDELETVCASLEKIDKFFNKLWIENGGK